MKELQRLMCPDCSNGEMEATGIMLLSYPPQYEHKCNRCYSKRNMRETYPKLVELDPPVEVWVNLQGYKQIRG